MYVAGTSCLPQLATVQQAQPEKQTIQYSGMKAGFSISKEKTHQSYINTGQLQA